MAHLIMFRVVLWASEQDSNQVGDNDSRRFELRGIPMNHREITSQTHQRRDEQQKSVRNRNNLPSREPKRAIM